jgi:hypothetical protein
MAQSAAFSFIQGKPQSKTPIYAKFKAEPNQRELCPHVLGFQKGGGTAPNDERVLCYQLAYNGFTAGWRSFKVSDLTVIKPRRRSPTRTIGKVQTIPINKVRCKTRPT